MYHDTKTGTISYTVNGYSPKCDHLPQPTASTYFRPWDAQENETTTATTSTDSMVDQVTHQKKHTEYVAHKMEDMVDKPTSSNNITSIPSTTTIPPSSMAAIQQSMANAMPPLLPTPVSPYGDRMTRDMMAYYTQPLFMDTAGNILPYPTHYNPANPYLYNMAYQQQGRAAQLLPVPPGYAHHAVHSLPYAPLPRNPVADHYYHPNMATSWSNVPYSNNMATPYLKQPSSTHVYAAAMQQNMSARIKQGPSSAPLPTSVQYTTDKPSTAGLSRSQSCSTNVLPRNDSATRKSQATQQSIVTTTPCPEVQTPSTSAQVANERKNVTKTHRTIEVTKPVVPPKTPAVLPTSTKTNVNSIVTDLPNLLQEEKHSSSRTTKRKCIDDIQEEDASAKKLKLMCTAFKLDNILPYRPNMARNRPKKDESEAKQIAREQNTIACRKYRRMRRIAKIMEQKLIEAESASEFANIL